MLSIRLFFTFISVACLSLGSYVQDDWLSPQASESWYTGETYTVAWDSDLQSWFGDYCPACDTQNVDLWLTGSGSNYYLVKAGINVESTTSCPYTVPDGFETDKFVFRFIPSGVKWQNGGEEISGALFYIRVSPTTTSSSESSTASPSTSTIEDSPASTTEGSTTTIDTASSTSPAVAAGSSSSPTESASASASESASPTSSTTSASTADSTGAPTSTSSDSTTGLSIGAKAGVGVGAAAGVIALIVLSFLFARRQRQSKAAPPPTAYAPASPSTPQSPPQYHQYNQQGAQYNQSAAQYNQPAAYPPHSPYTKPHPYPEVAELGMSERHEMGSSK
ncbi:hypothetical protein F5Y18DRAFT_351642 [Xylariaceae sp. FL1019]|nr:hypothetical protein F5Y18DRAFT_351642 [Xylariaceae sp. FL1019]